MNYVLSIINPYGAGIMKTICEGQSLPIVLSASCRGTATRNMLDLLGIESKERRLFVTIASAEQTKALIQEQRRRLYIDAPGNGITISVPVKSVGGSNTLAILSNGQNVKGAPSINYDYELIIAISDLGSTDLVMEAARSAGARGGTVIHGLGTGSRNKEKFYNVSIASEKEIIMIVSAAEHKAAIMKAIVEKAGGDDKAAAVVFSLPVTEIAGFGITQEKEE